MSEEILEKIILGHISKELKDEIEIGRQVNLAKTIMQSLHKYYIVQSEQLPDHKCKFYVNVEWTKLKCDCVNEQSINKKIN